MNRPTPPAPVVYQPFNYAAFCKSMEERGIKVPAPVVTPITFIVPPNTPEEKKNNLPLK